MEIRVASSDEQESPSAFSSGATRGYRLTSKFRRPWVKSFLQPELSFNPKRATAERPCPCQHLSGTVHGSHKVMSKSLLAFSAAGSSAAWAEKALMFAVSESIALDMTGVFQEIPRFQLLWSTAMRL